MADDVLREVEALQWERYVQVYLLAVSATASEHAEVPAGLAALLEPLKVDNENGRSLVNLQLFLRSNVLLTLIAVPHVVFVEDFRFLKLIEAIFDIDCTLLVSLRVNVSAIDSLAHFHARQVLDEVLVERVGPADVKDEVVLASIVTIEANVIVNACLVQHVEQRELVRVRQRAVASAGRLIAPMTWLHATVGPIVFNFEVVRRLIMVESAHLLIQKLAPVGLRKRWEECLELSLQRILLNHLHELVVVQQFFAAWSPVVWRLRCSCTVAVLLVVV